MKLPRDKKVRLRTGVALATDVKRLIVAMPVASDGAVHNVGPTPQLHDIPLKDKTEFVELNHTATGDMNGSGADEGC